MTTTRCIYACAPWHCVIYFNIPFWLLDRATKLGAHMYIGTYAPYKWTGESLHWTSWISKWHSQTSFDDIDKVTVKKLMNCRICFQVIYCDIIHQKVHMNNKCLKNEGKNKSRASKGVKLNQCHQTSPYYVYFLLCTFRSSFHRVVSPSRTWP